eukprot:TRINITY_DN17587_c3_g1_i1.p2 TRINITY_DN17587_c3_g1~~TRINITY_DN17587_c3_g1_i1.p2  ORF type:complete len:137 (-),score=18.68 TRINITY_DN17587_c3_g1_i1:71-481(-)
MPFKTKWGPFNCIVLAMLLCMADLTRHLCNDAWGTSCTELDDGQRLAILSSSGQTQDLGEKYTKYCSSRNVGNEYKADGSLSVYGWVFTIFCTWTGFALLFTGICWVINLPSKVSAQWRQIQARRAANARLLGSQA